LNKSILSEEEQGEILSALQGLSNVRTAETDNILQRLSTFFNRPVVNWLDVDFSYWSYSDTGHFNDLKMAILNRRIAEFDYYATYGVKTRSLTRRRIEPLQLKFKSKAWYVKGFCLTRQDVRTFKLTRIDNLDITNEYFAERDISAKSPIPNNQSQAEPNLMIKLKIDPEMAHRVYDEFHEKMAELQPDGSFIVTTYWPEDEWVYGTILSYGEYIEVLEPAHIREVIKTRIGKTAKRYL